MDGYGTEQGYFLDGNLTTTVYPAECLPNEFFKDNIEENKYN